MLPYQMIAGGTFTLSVSDGAASRVEVFCQSQNPPDFIIARAITGWGRLNSENAVETWWERSMPQGYAKIIRQSSSASLPNMTTFFINADGISTYDTTNPPTFTPVAMTALTGTAGTFIATVSSSASFSVGDFVRLYSTTGELQIAGYTFQITAISDSTHITLGYMASSGITFAADATAGFVQRIIPNRMYPRWDYIANITKATQAVVYFTTKNDFTPGEYIRLHVSSAFGMDEVNEKQVRVLSVTNSSTVSSVTIDLDTTGYTTFAFPTSAVAAAGVSPAVAVPSSSGVVPYNGSATIAQEPPGTNLQDAFDNRNKRIIVFGAGIFNADDTNVTFAPVDGDKWMWNAYKYDIYNEQ